MAQSAPSWLTNPRRWLRVAAHEIRALKQAAGMTPTEWQSRREAFVNNALASGLRRQQTGVRWFVKFCVHAKGRAPMTELSQHSPWEEQLEATQLLMDFAVWLAVSRPSGRPIAAKTIGKYLSHVRMWHRQEFFRDIIGDDFGQLKELLKGIARTVTQPPKLERWGVRTQDLAASMQATLNPASAVDSNWFAALTCAFCGLLRAAEFSLQPGEAFDPARHLTRADVTFVTEADGSEYAVIRMRPAKRTGATKTVPLVLGGGGTLLDPVRALRHLLDIDPVPEAQRASTPLFRQGGQRPFTVEQVRGTVKYLMLSLRLDPRKFGAHSLRIGGATAALSAGLSPAAIRAAGRWASDVYILYTRCNMHSAVQLASVIGSTSFEDTERGIKFADEELLLMPDEMPAIRFDEYLSTDMLEDLEDET